jgi:hypothetical protein
MFTPMRILPCFAAVATLAQASSASVFETETWPGEGLPQFRAVTHEIVIREIPSKESKVIRRLPVTPGQRIAFDSTRFRTLEPGRIAALSATSVSGRVLGNTQHLTRDEYYKGRFPHDAIALTAGDRFEYLQYRAEGTCFVRIADQVVDAKPCPAEDSRRFRVISQPKTEWWIRVLVDGASLGWVLVEDRTLRLTVRSG